MKNKISKQNHIEDYKMVASRPTQTQNQQPRGPANQSRLALRSQCRNKALKPNRLSASPAIWPQRASKAPLQRQQTQHGQLAFKKRALLQAILRSKIKPALIKLPLTIMVGAAANASKGSATKNTSIGDATAHASKGRASDLSNIDRATHDSWLFPGSI